MRLFFMFRVRYLSDDDDETDHSVLMACVVVEAYSQFMVYC